MIKPFFSLSLKKWGWLVGLGCLVGLGAGGCASVRLKKSAQTTRLGWIDRFHQGRRPPSTHQAQASPQAVSVAPVSEDSQKPLKSLGGDSSSHKGQFQWPLKSVHISSPFGMRKGKKHQGIDLRADIGTPVFAAREGTVLYVGARIKGYGKLVVLRHEGGLATIYAHNSRYFVQKGQRVKQGQKIALSGNTGRSSGPHLHFEIRQGIQPVNPMAFLAPLRQPQASRYAKKMGNKGGSQSRSRS